jgi:hypothetical protein
MNAAADHHVLELPGLDEMPNLPLSDINARGELLWRLKPNIVSHCLY